MKIALVVPGGVDRTGEYRVIPALLALIRRLARQHEVHVFALYQEPEPATWELFGARIHNIGNRGTRWRALRAVYAEHRKGAFQVIQAIWSGMPGLVAMLAAAVTRVPYCVHVAGGELVALRDITYGASLSWRGRLREVTVLRAARRVTAASRPMLDSLAALRIAAKKLPLGVDLAAWPPREPRRRPPDQPARLIHVASLNKVKDQCTLLHAMATLAQQGVSFELDVVGEDTLHGEVQSLSDQLNLRGKVKFHGFLPQSRVRPLVEAAHLMIISSRHEAGPLAVLEAAVSGVPTVGTAVGHIAEWSPRAARCVPVGDSAGLARAIREVLESEDQRLQLAGAAFEIATREDADFTASSLLDVWKTAGI